MEPESRCLPNLLRCARFVQVKDLPVTNVSEEGVLWDFVHELVCREAHPYRRSVLLTHLSELWVLIGILQDPKLGSPETSDHEWGHLLHFEPEPQRTQILKSLCSHGAVVLGCMLMADESESKTRLIDMVTTRCISQRNQYWIHRALSQKFADMNPDVSTLLPASLLDDDENAFYVL